MFCVEQSHEFQADQCRPSADKGGRYQEQVGPVLPKVDGEFVGSAVRTLRDSSQGPLYGT